MFDQSVSCIERQHAFHYPIFVVKKCGLVTDLELEADPVSA
jgi:hypothetical protein